jgi:hypothetical protein
MVNATDDYGNTGYDFSNDTFTVDNTAPFVTVIAPNGGEIFSDTLVIEWDAGDNITAVGTIKIDIQYSPDNGTTWHTIVTAFSNTGRYDYTIKTWDDGKRYRLRINATDEAGNTGRDLSDDVFMVDTTPPTVEILDPEESYLYILDRIKLPTIFGRTIVLGEVTVDIQAHDERFGVDRVNLLVDNTLKDVFWEQPYEWLWDDSLGIHTLEAKAYDIAGNTASDTIEVIIINS